MRDLMEAIEKLLEQYYIIPKTSPGKLCCSECGCQIHRFERFTIISVRHRDCRDPKMVGQEILPAEVN